MARATTAALALALLSLAGCQTAREIGREPELTPVGSGLATQQPIITQNYPQSYAVPANGYSLWSEKASNLYISQRALQEGDVLTVLIAIDDSARLNNASDRSREGGGSVGLNANYNYGVTGTAIEAAAGTGAGSLKLGASGGSDYSGKGTIARSERVRLSIAAIVTQVLPNGNLVVRGTQEVRVNAELRILEITGIVRPGDILPNNTIPYDRIAEARISYGGRGRISEVQQPRWGQQVVDLVSPF